MTQFLPPNLLVLFAPRDPPPFLPPAGKLTHEKKRQPYTGVAEYLQHFEDPEETPPPTKIETKEEKIERKRREKAEQNLYRLEQEQALWDPKTNPESTSDPYKTLFVSRINYDTSESKLRREFESYGKIKQIKIIHDQETGKPRGYAFIEYENESDMHAAYKRADGKKIDGKRVLVDIERGRTIKGWKPRRFGGGKGGRKSHFDPMAESRGTRGASYENESRVREDRDRDRDRNRDRDVAGGDRDKERDRERKRSKDRSRSRDRERRKRSKSKDRHRSRSKDRSNKKARRSKSKDRSTNTSSKKRSRSRSRDRIKSTKDEHSNGNGNGNNGYENNYIKNDDTEPGEW